MVSSTLKTTTMEKGMVLLDQKRYYEAGQCFYDVINNNQRDPNARYWYGRCFYKLAKQYNQTELFSQYLQHALECFDVAVKLKKY